MRVVERKELLQLCVVFSLAFVFSSALLFSQPSIFGLDSYYNLRYSSLISKQGILFEFPWLYYTTLNKNFFDQHFLYHLLLAPFTLQGDLLFAARISGAFFAALAIAGIWFFMRKNNVRFAWIFALLVLLASRNFFLRFVEARPIALSVFLLFAGIFLIQKKKILALFALSFFFVWVHTTFVILPLFLLAWLAVNYLEKKEIEWKLFAACIAGIALGLVLNPYFPADINHLFIQYFNVALFRNNALFQNSEWLSPDWHDFLATNSLFWGLLVFSLALYFWKRQRLAFETKALLAGFAVFFLLALKSMRFIDYAVPLGIVFSGFLLRDFLNKAEFKHSLKELLSSPVVWVLFLLAVSLAVFTASQAFGSAKVFNERNFSECSEWLAANSKKGEIVFNLRFDEFPMLYYEDQQNYYVLGLDEVYLFEYNKALFEKFKAVQNAEPGFHEILKNDFNASFVFLSKRSFNLPVANAMNERKQEFDLAVISKNCVVFRVL